MLHKAGEHKRIARRVESDRTTCWPRQVLFGFAHNVKSDAMCFTTSFFFTAKSLMYKHSKLQLAAKLL